MCKTEEHANEKRRNIDNNRIGDPQKSGRFLVTTKKVRHRDIRSTVN